MGWQVGASALPPSSIVTANLLPRILSWVIYIVNRILGENTVGGVNENDILAIFLRVPSGAINKVPREIRLWHASGNISVFPHLGPNHPQIGISPLRVRACYSSYFIAIGSSWI